MGILTALLITSIKIIYNYIIKIIIKLFTTTTRTIDIILYTSRITSYYHEMFA
jgi:hypothetical protein